MEQSSPTGKGWDKIDQLVSRAAWTIIILLSVATLGVKGYQNLPTIDRSDYHLNMQLWRMSRI